MIIDKIIYKNRGTIEVLFENKRILVIKGEMMAVPKFYAYFDTVKKFEPPFENEIISEDLKKSIVKKIIEFSNSNGNPPTPVYFEE